MIKGTAKWREDKRRGSNAEDFFSAHFREICGADAEFADELEQIAHNEGDFVVYYQDGSRAVYEVKADGKGAYLQTGNVCVQISNDAGTRVGALQDMLDPDKRHVDYVTFFLCSDYDCNTPYAAITLAVLDLARLCGCPDGWCESCRRCRPGADNWQMEAFPGKKLKRDTTGRWKGKTTLLLPLNPETLAGTDHRVNVFNAPRGQLLPYERRRWRELVEMAGAA